MQRHWLYFNIFPFLLKQQRWSKWSNFKMYEVAIVWCWNFWESCSCSLFYQSIHKVWLWHISRANESGVDFIIKMESVCVYQKEAMLNLQFNFYLETLFQKSSFIWFFSIAGSINFKVLPHKCIFNLKKIIFQFLLMEIFTHKSRKLICLNWNKISWMKK